MIVTLGIAIGALLISLGVWGGALTEQLKVEGGATNAAWLGLVGCFILIYTNQAPGLAAAVAAASFAAAATSPTRIGSPRRRGDVIGVSSALSVALGIAATILAANTFYQENPADPNLILVAGHWSALAAAAASAAGAAAAMLWRRGRPAGVGLGLWVAALVGGAALLGHLRSDVGQLGYMLPLSSAGDPVRWALPSLTAGARGFAFQVTTAAPFWVDVGMGVTGLGALAAGLGGAQLGRARAAGLWAGAGAGALAALSGVLTAGFGATLPSTAPYVAHARALGGEQKIPERVLELGRFVHEETVYVLWVDILPDLGLLAAAALVCLTVAWRLMREIPEAADADEVLAHPRRVTPSEADGVAALWSRDMLVRAAALVWVAWILSRFVTWRVHATYGFGGPGEWVWMGCALAAGGLAVLGWSPAAGPRRVGPGVLAALVTLAVAASLALGA